jgi:hypothetical protein
LGGKVPREGDPVALAAAVQRKKVGFMAPKEWGAALSHFQLLFPERLPAG